MNIKKTALIGIGAIGTVYGKLLYDKYGSDFAVIAGGGRGEKLKSGGVTLNRKTFYPRVFARQEDGYMAELIILCVKNYQLEEALKDIRPYVKKETVLLPLLNGITARDRILEKYPCNRVLYGLSIHIDAVREADGVTNTENGTIQFGDADNTNPAPEVIAVREYLTAAKIKAQICEDMIRAMWRKWMLNVGCNQVSAITGAAYGKLMSIESNKILFHEAMMEIAELAKAAQINLTEADALEFEKILSTLSPDGKTSMLQDVEAKRQTEVEYFSGTAVKLGEKLHVPTPVNRVLYCIIKAKEEMY